MKLYRACTSREYQMALQKEFLIRRLLEIGIDEYNGRDIHELNYDELKRILALTRATRS
ncbi:MULTISPECIES: hypothetical protein [Geobacillus]|uniref:hypothetical protein n=1 Tax=Geobacillus TaxID=129337 RepID=UPI0006E4FB37|nr:MULTISPECIES: hypothetical protein [Geobacillus]KQB91910.1 hypothetical protein GEPA3_3049 [Geobacillus sp. PA-3]MED4916743.1 hypothetical protein [Geobacillus thermodenitrificans]